MVSDNARVERLAIQPFTSSEAGAWSNSYLLSGASEALLFDVCMLRGDAVQRADMIARTGKTLTTVMISHAHPDHFMGLDVITDRFPKADIVSTANVAADIRQDGPWMCSMLQSKLGGDGPERLVIPEALPEPTLHIEGDTLDVVEFGEGESKHLAALYIQSAQTLLSADLVYHDAHLYLQERHLESWLRQLDELEAYAKPRVSTIYPGHGTPSDLRLIDQTRQYLRDFADAVKTGDPKKAEAQMLAKYSGHHVKQFLTVFSLPAYLPTTSPAPAQSRAGS
jgi:glyoxylase-like metal-dependent hydrolase (beta-lactamase superfamily II)